MPLYGLIGYPLDHSWSKEYFDKKFAASGLPSHEYRLFPIEQIGQLPSLIQSLPALQGFNVTAPYKKAVIPFLQQTDDVAIKIGAVNTVEIIRTGETWKLTGYNTDAWGFLESVRHLLTPRHKKALILGTGGAARAARFALESLGIRCQMVSRTPIGHDQIGLGNLSDEIIEKTQIIINATPVGQFPHISHCPAIPFQAIHKDHLVIDLIYNPEKTLFLQKAENNGAITLNGLKMLYLQADKSWDIWNDPR